MVYLQIGVICRYVGTYLSSYLVPGQSGRVGLQYRKNKSGFKVIVKSNKFLGGSIISLSIIS